jgi:NADH-quinone oxidoreductase subunit I
MTEVYEFSEYDRYNLIYNFSALTAEQVGEVRAKQAAYEKEQAAKKAAAVKPAPAAQPRPQQQSPGSKKS